MRLATTALIEGQRHRHSPSMVIRAPDIGMPRRSGEFCQKFSGGDARCEVRSSKLGVAIADKSFALSRAKSMFSSVGDHHLDTRRQCINRVRLVICKVLEDWRPIAKIVLCVHPPNIGRDGGYLSLVGHCPGAVSTLTTRTVRRGACNTLSVILRAREDCLRWEWVSLCVCHS